VNEPSPVSILHAADIHLGTGPSRAEEAAFERLVDMANAQEVDALLIAGDLFETNRVSANVVEWCCSELDRFEGHTVILPGNHDALVRDGVYRRHALEQRCRSVTVIDEVGGRAVEFASVPLTVWGRPVVDHAETSRPLLGIPARPDGRYAVVIAHGLVVEREDAGGRGSPIYPSDLDAVDWDYVALGHWGRFLEVRYDPPVVYAGPVATSGSILPGAVLVNFEPGRPPRWDWLRLDV
jgi:DNA repair protein SbcD/Mre11